MASFAGPHKPTAAAAGGPSKPSATPQKKTQQPQQASAQKPSHRADQSKTKSGPAKRKRGPDVSVSVSGSTKGSPTPSKAVKKQKTKKQQEVVVVDADGSARKQKQAAGGEKSPIAQVQQGSGSSPGTGVRIVDISGMIVVDRWPTLTYSFDELRTKLREKLDCRFSETITFSHIRKPGVEVAMIDDDDLDYFKLRLSKATDQQLIRATVVPTSSLAVANTDASQPASQPTTVICSTPAPLLAPPSSYPIPASTPTPASSASNSRPTMALAPKPKVVPAPAQIPTPSMSIVSPAQEKAQTPLLKQKTNKELKKERYEELKKLAAMEGKDTPVKRKRTGSDAATPSTPVSEEAATSVPTPSLPSEVVVPAAKKSKSTTTATTSTSQAENESESSKAMEKKEETGQNEVATTSAVAVGSPVQLSKRARKRLRMSEKVPVPAPVIVDGDLQAAAAAPIKSVSMNPPPVAPAPLTATQEKRKLARKAEKERKKAIKVEQRRLDWADGSFSSETPTPAPASVRATSVSATATPSKLAPAPKPVTLPVAVDSAPAPAVVAKPKPKSKAKAKAKPAPICTPTVLEPPSAIPQQTFDLIRQSMGPSSSSREGSAPISEAGSTLGMSPAEALFKANLEKAQLSKRSKKARRLSRVGTKSGDQSVTSEVTDQMQESQTSEKETVTTQKGVPQQPTSESSAESAQKKPVPKNRIKGSAALAAYRAEQEAKRKQAEGVSAGETVSATATAAKNGSTPTTKDVLGSSQLSKESEVTPATIPQAAETLNPTNSDRKTENESSGARAPTNALTSIPPVAPIPEAALLARLPSSEPESYSDDEEEQEEKISKRVKFQRMPSPGSDSGGGVDEDDGEDSEDDSVAASKRKFPTIFPEPSAPEPSAASSQVDDVEVSSQHEPSMMEEPEPDSANKAPSEEQTEVKAVDDPIESSSEVSDNEQEQIEASQSRLEPAPQYREIIPATPQEVDELDDSMDEDIQEASKSQVVPAVVEDADPIDEAEAAAEVVQKEVDELDDIDMAPAGVPSSGTPAAELTEDEDIDMDAVDVQASIDPSISAPPTPAPQEEMSDFPLQVEVVTEMSPPPPSSQASQTKPSRKAKRAVANKASEVVVPAAEILVANAEAPVDPSPLKTRSGKMRGAAAAAQAAITAMANSYKRDALDTDEPEENVGSVTGATAPPSSQSEVPIKKTRGRPRKVVETVDETHKDNFSASQPGTEPASSQLVADKPQPKKRGRPARESIASQINSQPGPSIAETVTEAEVSLPSTQEKEKYEASSGQELVPSSQPFLPLPSANATDVVAAAPSTEGDDDSNQSQSEGVNHNLAPIRSRAAREQYQKQLSRGRCMVCDEVPGHFQKDCPIIIKGLPALRRRQAEIKDTADERTKTIFDTWIHRLEEDERAIQRKQQSNGTAEVVSSAPPAPAPPSTQIPESPTISEPAHLAEGSQTDNMLLVATPKSMTPSILTQRSGLASRLGLGSQPPPSPSPKTGTRLAARIGGGSQPAASNSSRTLIPTLSSLSADSLRKRTTPSLNSARMFAGIATSANEKKKESPLGAPNSGDSSDDDDAAGSDDTDTDSEDENGPAGSVANSLPGSLADRIAGGTNGKRQTRTNGRMNGW